MTCSPAWPRGGTHAGTFNGNTVATAAVLASIDELASGEVYEQVGKIGTALIQSVRDCAEASGLDLHVQGLPMAFHASFAPPGPAMTRYRDLARSDPARYAGLADALIGHGVWVARRGIWYVSAAHTEADVTETSTGSAVPSARSRRLSGQAWRSWWRGSGGPATAAGGWPAA